MQRKHEDQTHSSNVNFIHRIADSFADALDESRFVWDNKSAWGVVFRASALSIGGHRGAAAWVDFLLLFRHVENKELIERG
jgi:hypothetical protein